MPQKEVFVISKPIVPPWNDSGKNIAKEQICHGDRYSYRILTTRDFAFPEHSHVSYERIYPSGGHFKAGLKQNIKVMFRGLQKKHSQIYHYFFAPNRLSATAGRLQRAATRVKTVQTFSSRPLDYNDVNRFIFTDKVIVLSKDSRDKLLSVGISPKRVVHIPPGITPPAPLAEDEKTKLRDRFDLKNNRIVLFPGDFEFSNAASLVAQAAPAILAGARNVSVIFACRAKTERSKSRKQQIQKELSSLGHRVRFLDEIEEMHRFVGLVDVLLLPQNNLYAKMDIPLILLEAMAHGIPLVLADTGPLNELIAQNAAIGACTSADVAAAALRLLHSPAEAGALGRIGHALVHTTYNALSMAKAVENLYDELLE
ncbi:MAG: glycosyltransferase family 4 protein [Deltaproteobacteria bacterium]|nr:glycosyltransferase family 4 protein [Deltaproteobacteria bacterium]